MTGIPPGASLPPSNDVPTEPTADPAAGAASPAVGSAAVGGAASPTVGGEASPATRAAPSGEPEPQPATASTVGEEPASISDGSAVPPDQGTSEAAAEEEPRRRGPAMFRSLVVRNYRLFAMGQVVSNTGTWMQRIAQDWLVLQLSGGSGIALGITTAAQFLPMLILGLWGGALVDRLNKRRLLIVTQASMGVLALGLGVLATSGAAQVWHVYLFALALGMVTVVDNPARQTFVIEMVGKRDLPNAIALNGASFQLGRVTGPAVAGLLIGIIGSGPVFLINSLSFVAVLGSLIMMRPQELHESERAEKGKGQVRDGLRYIAGRPDIMLLLAMTAFLSLFGTNIQNQIALMTNNVFEAGATAFGLAGTAIAVGSLAGALIAARRERPRLRILVVAAFAFGLLQVLSAFAPGYPTFALALVPMGIAFLSYTTTMNSTLQLTVDPTMRGRVMSLYLLFFLGMAPLGAPIVGWLADAFGPRVSLAVGGVVGMVVTVITAFLLMRTLAARASIRWRGWPRLVITRERLGEEE